jgi:ribosomal protein S18 acetylase RimI-like enzyme
MKTRNYTNDDYPEIVTILKDSDLFDEVWDSEDNLKSFISKNPQSILVAEEQGKVVGNIIIIPYGKKVSYLFRLAVKKEYRKQGIASSLIEKAEEIVGQVGTTELGLYVDSGNINLQEFYKKRGFKISPKTYYYMWKEL